MISAIGTVLFWMAAFVGACIVIFFGILLAVGVGALAWQLLRAAGLILWAPFALVGAGLDWADRKMPWKAAQPRSRTYRPASMTPDQYFMWANRRGPYRDA